MSSEQFDKQIKNKLEQVQPPYAEQAWQNFQPLLPAPWYVTLFKTYSSWLYSGLGTVAMVAISSLYYQEKQENNQLHEKITTLQSQITQLKTTPAIPPARVPGDTVPARRPVTPDRPALPEIPEIPATQKNQSQVAAENKAGSRGRVTPEDRSAVPAGTAPTPASSSNPIPNKTTPAQNPDTITPGVTSDNKAPATIPAQTDSTLPPPQNPATLTKQEATPPNNIPPGKDSIATRSPPDSANAAAAAKPGPAEKSANQAAFMQIRLGLHSDVNGFRKAALGPALEVLFGHRLSLNTGLLFGTPEEQRLPLPRDYNRATGRRFEDDYRRHIPRNDRLQGIVVNTSIIWLPVGFNYYLPVKGKVSFMAMAGTRLNLSVYQTVEFRSFNGGEEQLNKFETDYKPTPFNSLYYGLGWQYRFGRLVGQVAPYFDLYFREPDYFNQSKKFGVNAAIKFDLRK